MGYLRISAIAVAERPNAIEGREVMATQAYPRRRLAPRATMREGREYQSMLAPSNWQDLATRWRYMPPVAPDLDIGLH